MTLAVVVLVILGAASGAFGDCVSQPSVGLCRARMPRYFYNATSGQCQYFEYGGCGGNANNYQTLAECQKSCVHLSLEDCSAAPETGMCRAHFPSTYFDIKDGKCKDFVYGGCGGNNNIFGDEQECLSKCGQYANKKQLSQEECFAEAETGLCRAYIPSYYFSFKTGKCESFVYGGCGGNTNNFRTVEECNGQCGKYAPIEDEAVVPEEVQCTAEPEVGPCRAAMPRHFWNHRTGKCQLFTYGGCAGNSNNFGSEEECQNSCKGTPVELADCSLEPETGMCMAYFPSYFYNYTSGQCESFVYGGCGGNANRFWTHTACHATCHSKTQDKKPVVGVCAEPKQVGLCQAIFPRFYYDVETASCRPFTYGGCGGNGNNFATIEDCHNTCIA